MSPLFALVVCNLGVRGVHGNSIFGRLLETLRASPYFGPVQGPPASTSRCASNLTSRRTAPFAVWCDDVGALRLLDRRPSGPWWLPRCGRHAVYVRRLAVFVRRLADFVRRLADFQNHAGPRLTLLRLRGGVQGRRPRLRL